MPDKNIDDLKLQIGDYSKQKTDVAPADFAKAKLSGEGLAALHAGIDEYKNGHSDRIRKYIDKYKIPFITSDLNDPHFFRKRLIDRVGVVKSTTGNEYIKSMDPNLTQSEREALIKTNTEKEALRKTKPEKATIDLKDLLKVKNDPEDGDELYKMALQEERNSEEYMDAVFQKSTKHYEGETLTVRPVIIVSGPSGCGKSRTADNVVKETAKHLTATGTHGGHDVVSVDGGVAREVSQMRKLMIQLANQKGFTGVKDLHDQSKVLNGDKENSAVKDNIQNAAFKTSNLGVVIPETFSEEIKPWSSKADKMLDTIQGQFMTKMVFCRIDGEDDSQFKKTVGFMGSRRAWELDNFNKDASFDLNNTEVKESKAYGSGGFLPGREGSKKVEKKLKERDPNALTIKVTNDLILLKRSDSPLDTDRKEKWEPANQDDPGTILISKAVYNEWRVKQTQGNTASLLDYQKSCDSQMKMEFSPGFGKLNAHSDESDMVEQDLESEGDEWVMVDGPKAEREATADEVEDSTPARNLHQQ